MTRRTPPWHPWREARARGHLRISFDAPSAVRGRHGRDGRVELHPTMTQAERRSALTHELIHDERQVYPRDVVLAAREERTVEALAARRLIDLNDLVEVLRWTRHEEEAAEELWVDVPMLLALIRSLTDDERMWINMRIEDRPC
ncbi:hypothetical protein [Tsukamurella asaccharolytica]|nr:hypothetical protein [Tsukamurella asaccharolytica]